MKASSILLATVAVGSTAASPLAESSTAAKKVDFDQALRNFCNLPDVEGAEAARNAAVAIIGKLASELGIPLHEGDLLDEKVVSAIWH